MSSLINIKRPGSYRSHRNCLFVSICLVVCFLIHSNVLAQEAMPAEWKFLKEVENVRFFYAESQCESQPFLLLRIENMNPAQVFGTWLLRVTAGGFSHTYVGILTDVQPMAVREGSCNVPDPNLTIPQMQAATQLTVSLDVNITKP